MTPLIIHRLTGSRKFRALPVRQRGIILVMTLIILVVLMISGVALIRSYDTSLMLAGNLGFKRDLVNQGERGITTASGYFASGGVLFSSDTHESNLYSSNYSATQLATNDYGIPSMLLDDSLFTSMTAGDITDSTGTITVRYVIDRLCSGTGAPTRATCVSLDYSDGGGGAGGEYANSGPGGGGEGRAALSPTVIPAFRISVRITGPRNTQTFIQSTFMQ